MERFDYLLIGGGIASSTCAEVLRNEGATGSIAIFGAERYRPYHRPPLSKGLLLDYETEEGIWTKPEDFYAKNKIELKLGRKIASLSSDNNIVTDDSGEQYEFDKLFIGTGCELRRIPIKGSDLQNVFYLRTIEHSRAIKKAMESARNAVVIGAGFMGMELASAFAQKDIMTTMVVREDTIFAKMGSKAISDHFLKYYTDHGVDILLEEETAGIKGDQKVEKVVTKSGRALSADIVVIGVGVFPDIEFLKDSGLDINNGIVVNEYLESVNRPGVFAAGDMANYYDPIFEKNRRVEHWDHARRQGGLAARNMLGKNEPMNFIAYFYSEMFELSWEFLGDNSDVDEIITRGSLGKDNAIMFFLKENRLKAAFLMMAESTARSSCAQLMINKIDLTDRKHELTNESGKLEDILKAA